LLSYFSRLILRCLQLHPIPPPSYTLGSLSELHVCKLSRSSIATAATTQARDLSTLLIAMLDIHKVKALTDLSRELYTEENSMLYIGKGIENNHDNKRSHSKIKIKK